jgi:hypothetical protein
MISKVVVLTLVPTLASCIVQPAPQPATQPTGAAPIAAPAPAGAPAPATDPSGRSLRFNRVALDQRGWQVIAQLEGALGRRLPDGEYWYDATCGAAGVQGGPALAILPAGLPLGGPLLADASGGGAGRVTAIFINGREIHPVDAQTLTQLVGQQVQPGRYWVDAQGNAGQEGGPPLVNLYQLARQRGTASGNRGWNHATQGPNGALYGGSDGSTNYFFDGASGCSVMNDGGGVQC